MNPVLASSLEFEEYLAQKRNDVFSGLGLEIHGNKKSKTSRLSTTGSNGNNSSSSSSRKKPQLIQTQTSRSKSSAGPPVYKHSWGLHVRNQEERFNDDQNHNNSNNSNNKTPPLKQNLNSKNARWKSSVYDDTDVLAGLNLDDDNKYNHHNKYRSPDGVAAISDTHYDADLKYYSIDNYKNDENFNQYEKDQYDHYIERYVDSSSSNNHHYQQILKTTIDSTITTIDELENKLEEYMIMKHKQFKIKIFDRWRRCTWLDKQEILQKNEILETSYKTNLRKKCLIQWQQIVTLTRFSKRVAYRRGLLSLWNNLMRQGRNREMTRTGLIQLMRYRQSKAFNKLSDITTIARIKKKEIIVNEIALRFNKRKIKQRCWLTWNNYRILQRDMQAIESEQNERRSRIKNFVGTIKARTAAPPAPPNTPYQNINEYKYEAMDAFGLDDTAIRIGSSSSANNKVKSKRKFDYPKASGRSRIGSSSSTRDIRAEAKRKETQERDDKEVQEDKQEVYIAESKDDDNIDLDIDYSNDTLSKNNRLERQRELRKAATERVAAMREQAKEALRIQEQKAEKELEDLRSEKRKELEEKALKSKRLMINEEELLKRKQQLSIATTFRKKQLLIRCGLGPWQRLMNLQQEYNDKALHFRKDTCLETAWMALSAYCTSTKRSRVRYEAAQTRMAYVHHKRGLLMRTLKAWQLYRRMLRAKAIAVTGQFSRYNLGKRAWRAWQIALEQCRRAMAYKMRIYAVRGDQCVIKYFFRKWEEYYEGCLLDREIKYRTDATWNKIQDWLK